MGSNTTFAGIIGGSGGLTKAGLNALTLSGSNTFLGTTTVSAGSLMVAGAGSALTGPLVIDSGAVAGGNGAFNGGITVNGGGLLSVGVPGRPSTVAGPSLNLQTGSAVSFKIDTNPNNDSDYISTKLNNGLTLGTGITVNLYNMADGVSPYPPNPGDVLDLIGFSARSGDGPGRSLQGGEPRCLAELHVRL